MTKSYWISDIGCVRTHNEDSCLSMPEKQLYAVADLSDALGLSSASDVASNYVITTTMYDSGQTSVAGKLEKPSLTNINASRGVIEHTVEDGESVDTIAAKYGVSADQIRWSNGLKTSDVAPGTVLYVPSMSGIVYVVKAGDTLKLTEAPGGGFAVSLIAQ